MDEYKFKAKDYEATLYTRLHNYFAGLFGRKDYFKSFCHNNGIDYPLVDGKKYRVPDSYLIEHSELKFLAGVRDKSLLSLYDKYKDYQLKTTQEINKTQSQIANQEDYIESLKEHLKRIKEKLAREKDPSNKLRFQKNRGCLESKISNEKSTLAEYKQQLNSFTKILQSNTDSWIKQVEIVDSIFELRKNAFEKNLTKCIRRILNYTDFVCVLPSYSNSVKQILKGEYHVETK